MLGFLGIGLFFCLFNFLFVVLFVKENEYKEVILEEGEVESYSFLRDCSYVDLFGLVFGWIFVFDDCCSFFDF